MTPDNTVEDTVDVIGVKTDRAEESPVKKALTAVIYAKALVLSLQDMYIAPPVIGPVK